MMEVAAQESVQRILKRRALNGQHPQTPSDIIAWLEATARDWNRTPSPFMLGGKRAAHRCAGYHRHPRPFRSFTPLLDKRGETH